VQQPGMGHRKATPLRGRSASIEPPWSSPRDGSHEEDGEGLPCLLAKAYRAAGQALYGGSPSGRCRSRLPLLLSLDHLAVAHPCHSAGHGAGDRSCQVLPKPLHLPIALSVS
jgi:hypothetical protein